MGKYSYRRRGGMNLVRSLYLRALYRTLKDCESILDLGCGPSSKIQHYKVRKVGVEAHEPTFLKAQGSGTHDKLIQMDVRKISKAFSPNSFDAVVALDLIEHLKKSEGFCLLADMERIARKRVIVFTPNGFMPQTKKNENLQEHLSGWMSEEFGNRNYEVYGMNGLKSFRNGVSLKYHPRLMWGVLSFISQVMYAYQHPEVAGHLFAVRHLG